MPKIIPIDHRKLIRVFELAGFEIVRQRGSHIVMTKAEIKRPLVIKCSPKQISITHIRTNLTTAEISRDKYFESLKKI